VVREKVALLWDELAGCMREQAEVEQRRFEFAAGKVPRTEAEMIAFLRAERSRKGSGPDALKAMRRRRT
jgi:hypothetical protein